MCSIICIIPIELRDYSINRAIEKKYKNKYYSRRWDNLLVWHWVSLFSNKIASRDSSWKTGLPLNPAQEKKKNYPLFK